MRNLLRPRWLHGCVDDWLRLDVIALNEEPKGFGAHLWDSMSHVERAIPAAFKVAKPGTAEFCALRDEIEKTKDFALNNGLSNMTPDNHNGYDKRSAFVIEVKDGAFHLVR